MRTVQLLITLTGTRNGEDWPPLGGLMDLPDDEAEGYVRNGYARYAERPVPAPEEDALADPEPEEAVVAPEEAAVAGPEEQAVAPEPERRGGKRK
jgi:hypothetical protein